MLAATARRSQGGARHLRAGLTPGRAECHHPPAAAVHHDRAAAANAARTYRGGGGTSGVVLAGSLGPCEGPGHPAIGEAMRALLAKPVREVMCGGD